MRFALSNRTCAKELLRGQLVKQEAVIKGIQTYNAKVSKVASV